MKQLAELLRSATAALADALVPTRARLLLDRWGNRGRDLAAVLAERNGFYAFGGALLVRPMSNHTAPLGLTEWNQDALWRTAYPPEFGLAEALFFAEDVFGDQFCLMPDAVARFDAESGELLRIGEKLQDWLALLDREPDVVTAYPLLREWQLANPPLEPGWRLVPRKPFALGGEYTVDNLHACRDAEAMNARAGIASQLRLDRL